MARGLSDMVRDEADKIVLERGGVASTRSVEHLERENAKLRELVRDMWANQEALPYGLHIEIRDRMRELGVEVDG